MPGREWKTTAFAFILTFTHALRMWQNQSWLTITENTRFSESEEMAPKRHKTSNSPVNNLWTYGVGSVDVRPEGVSTYGVRGWGRTSRGCLDVRARNLWTVLHENWTNRLIETAQKVLFCAVFEPRLSSRLCGMADIFRMSKCHSSLGPGEPDPLALVLAEALEEYEKTAWLKIVENQIYKGVGNAW